MGIIDKCWVRGDATLCVVIFNYAVCVLILMTSPLGVAVGLLSI